LFVEQFALSGEDISQSESYGRVIHKAAFKRLQSMLQNEGTVVLGGQQDESQLYIAPTIIKLEVCVWLLFCFLASVHSNVCIDSLTKLPARS